MVQRSTTANAQLKLRLRETLRRVLAKEAKKVGRSLNQEMVLRLEKSFTLEEELAEAKTKLAEQEAFATLLEQAKDTLSQTQKANVEAAALREEARGMLEAAKFAKDSKEASK